MSTGIGGGGGGHGPLASPRSTPMQIDLIHRSDTASHPNVFVVVVSYWGT